MSDKTTSLAYGELSNEERVYMFEYIFAEAVRIVMQDNQITAYTNFVPPELQMERPRVGITFTPGAGQGQWNKQTGTYRESAWKGQYQLDIVTAADMAVHGRFVSRIRALMAGITALVNNTDPMQYHRIQNFFMDGGSSATLESDKGHYATSITYDVDYSIQANAWELLTS